MTPELKIEWLTALRSGKYQQTQGNLHRTVASDVGTPVGHCCLGVLCEIVAPRLKLSRTILIPAGGGECERFDNNSGRLSDVILAQVGLAVEEAAALVHQNDRGDSFAKIADYIEREIP